MARTGGVSGVTCTAVAGGDPSEERPCDAFAQVSGVADAVLYEGYLLYPYRRSSAKNRVRWQFGVLLPRDWVESDGPLSPGLSGSADSWYQQTECLLRVRRPDALVRVRVRYLQMQHKQVRAAGTDGADLPVESLRTDDGTTHLTFDEAVPHEIAFERPLDELLRAGCAVAAGAPAAEETEPLPGGAGRVVRRREEVRALTTVAAERLSQDVVRLRVRTEHTGHAPDARAPRGEALRRALLAAHTLLGGDGVEFVSQTDPPAELRAWARACRNEFTFPVLGGGPEETEPTGRVVLSSPIILPDRPQVAPESPGDLHDAAEIDEILTLRTMLLTDEEKAEARATDARAARILDRVDSMPPEVFARLHGAIRSLTPVGASSPHPAPATSPDGLPDAFSEVCPDAFPAAGRPAWWLYGADDGLSPATDTVVVDGVPVAGGSRVRLRPRGRGADAQDMFLEGRTARVAAVFHDVDGSVHLAVTVDDDPAAELHGWYGRFHYFRPDEVEPLAPPDAPGPADPDPPSRPRSPRPTSPAERPEEGRLDGRP
ncbi:hypothetical protein [Streptomyces collinus]|uniref:hypothetical protein n=1 Tax=Streptomyces collinus TaxID=42684 RepID=UPI001F302AA9|nr:hypothetical protein [Streptomyces collinus]UJA06235.1 hypothetical protein HGI10_01140 [Streptomyces collinus]